MRFNLTKRRNSNPFLVLVKVEVDVVDATATLRL